MSAARIAVHGHLGRLGRLVVEQAGEQYASPVLPDQPIPDCDVIIDVTAPQGTRDLLPRLTGQALVIGTTGDLPLDAIRAYARQAAVAIVPNFSVGVPLLLDLVQRAVGALPDGWQIEVIEAHHVHKKDAPSGTARRIVQAIGQDVPTHSLRVGDTVGEHTVWLSGPGERIELKHVATRREVFAIGAIRWARDMADRPAGLVQP